ncbi:MAG: hypothetical protein COW01_10985 [Bdellovibrionales bacterium CG12_big_fil_rev_8_21_14_0_65_38_15]|nr:MAG: hypothetical protein COW79_10395 [Bdellovibrionales bacterium CG22_combo_CG10-13_8_21_14_all_38_13]PIQ54375.1 MAG: hypothetical protein COW01_10985 [Bdellovibrionales bacterium CG12_big_fil_rev_8_21_14_0_65_38_15]PIR28708.1 MAG: hypothetical protein COV38_14300 [Bdellovibrionales bacterium CG11_big_fil_rev_8_21_14_0_20_38_13]
MGLRVAKGNNVKISKKLEAPTDAGKHFRLLCLTGKNKGVAYFMTGKRLVMGRHENCDIQILDTKSSREHAELTRVGDKFVLTDLGSQNGIIVNDLKVNQHTLADGDKVIVGQTVYKYSIFNNKKSEVLEDDLDDDDDDDEEETGKDKKPAGNRIIILVALLVGAFFFLGEDPKAPPAAKKSVEAINLSGVTKGVADTTRELDSELEKKVDTILHRGLREYREGNYFRAIEEFNLALILNPRSGRAAFYLEKAKQKLDAEVTQSFLRAKVAADALKYDSAVVTFCSIIKLISKNPDDERYKKAEKELGDLLERMGKPNAEPKKECQ